MSRLHLNVVLHEAQRQVAEAFERHRFVVLTAGRRFGKSYLALLLSLRTMLAQPDAAVLFASPVYAQARGRFREFRRLLRDQGLQHFVESANKSELRIVFTNGASITFASVYDADRIRGEGYDLAVLDECGFIDASVFYEVVRPALSDRLGHLLVTGTPRGKGQLLHTLHQRGAAGDPGWAAFQFPTSANSRILPEEIEDAQRGLPEDVFSQEYLAWFLESSAGVFRGISRCIGGSLEGPRSGHRYVTGVDLAQSRDFSVVLTLDAATRQVVDFQRFQGISYVEQVTRILETARRYNSADLIVDETGVGKPVVDNLRAALGRPRSDQEVDRRGGVRARSRVTGLVLTQQSKQDVIQRLQLELERARVQIPRECEVLLAELEVYGYEMTRTGRISYSAPEGFHDDTVIALALAVHSIPRHGFSIDHLDDRWRIAIERLRGRVWRPSRFGLPPKRGGGYIPTPNSFATAGGPLASGWGPRRDLQLEWRLLTLCRAAGLVSDDEAQFVATEIRSKAFATMADRVDYVDGYDSQLGTWAEFVAGSHPISTRAQPEQKKQPPTTPPTTLGLG